MEHLAIPWVLASDTPTTLQLTRRYRQRLSESDERAQEARPRGVTRTGGAPLRLFGTAFPMSRPLAPVTP
jgi:hypothetical protein